MSSYPSMASGLTYVDPFHFTVAGDHTNVFTPRRALLVQSLGVATTGVYVVKSICVANVTWVTVTGSLLPSVMTTVRLGQDTINAPNPANTGLLSFLATNTFVSP